MILKTHGIIFRIMKINVCLSKVAGIFMLLLVSVALEVPADAVTDHLESSATAVQGASNFDSFIPSSHEPDRMDPGSPPERWRTKRGTLVNALFALLTTAAGLSVKFLILQCFQGLQQRRGPTSSLQRLARGSDPCKLKPAANREEAHPLLRFHTAPQLIEF